MSSHETEHLRVLIANERKDRLALVAPIVVALGHEVIAREIDVADVGAVTARERPDVALVGLGESSQHALDLIDKIVREARLPGHRPAARPRPRLRQGGVQARRLRPHQRRRRRGLAELDRHRAAPLRRVPRPPGRLRTPRPDRTRQGHPHGTPLHRRRDRLRDAARTLPHRQPQAHRPRHRDRRRPPAAAAAAGWPFKRLCPDGWRPRPALRDAAGHRLRRVPPRRSRRCGRSSRARVRCPRARP